jgi:hypothetical protein
MIISPVVVVLGIIADLGEIGNGKGLELAGSIRNKSYDI